jgi:hypothetical protein
VRDRRGICFGNLLNDPQHRDADALIRNAGRSTHTRDLTDFRTMHINAENPWVRTHSSAVWVGHPHSALGQFSVRFQKKSEANADAPELQRGSATRTQDLVSFQKIQINTEFQECGRTHPQCGPTHPHSGLKQIFRKFRTQKISRVRTDPPAVRVNPSALTPKFRISQL